MVLLWSHWTTAQGALTQLWEISAGGPLPQAPPACDAQGLIYAVVGSYIPTTGVPQNKAQLLVLDAQGGRKWIYIAGVGNGSPATLGSDGTVYFTLNNADNPGVYSVKPDGSLLWRNPTTQPNGAGLALAADGTLYFTSWEGRLGAMSSSGTDLWTFTLNEPIPGIMVPDPPTGRPTVAADGTIYAGASHGELSAVTPQGQLLWSASAKEPADNFLYFTINTPVIGWDGTIYVTSNQPGGLGPASGHLFAFNPDGTRRWHFAAPRVFVDSPVVAADGSVYVGCADGNLYCLTAEGSLQWTFNAEAPVSGPPTLTAGGVAIVATSGGGLFAVDAQGQMTASFRGTNTFTTAPTLGPDGTIYVGLGPGFVGAFAGLGPPAMAQWPAFSHDASHTARATAMPPPAPPANVRASQTGPNVLLSWDAASAPVTYAIWRNMSQDFSTAVPLVEFLRTTNSYEDLTAPAGSALFYWLQARNAAGPGAVTGPVSAFRPTPAAGGVVWQLLAAGQAFNSAAQGLDGVIFATSYAYDHSITGFDTNGWLYALEPTGGVRWTRTFYEYVRASPAIADDGTVYVGCDDGNLYAVDPDNNLRWTFQSAGPIITTPAIGPDGTIYFCTQFVELHPGVSIRIYALHPDGSVKWSYPDSGDSPFTGTPAVTASGNVSVAGTYSVATFSAEGRLLWSANDDGQVAGATALNFDNSLCFATAGIINFPYQRGHLWNIASDGSANWSAWGGTNYYSTPSIGVDGAIYVGSESNALYAINPDGSTRWTAPTTAGVRVAPALTSDGGVYFGTLDGSFQAHAPDGSLVWQFSAGGPIQSSPLVLTSSNIVFGTDSGVLWCLRGTVALASSAWPMFQRDPQHSGRMRSSPPVPGAPNQVQAMPAGGCSGMIRVTWGSSSGADSYEVYRGTNDDPQQSVVVATNITTTLKYDDDTASHSVLYYYWIRAVNAAGSSSLSPAVSAMQSTKLWEYTLPGNIQTAPVIGDDGTAYIASLIPPIGPGSVQTNYAFAVRGDGDALWQLALPSPRYTIAASIGPDGLIYFVANDSTNSVAVVDPQGSLRTTISIGRAPQGALAIGADGTLYYVGSGWIGAISPDGRKLWEGQTLSGGFSPIVGPDGTIYLGTPDAIAAYSSNGDKKWITGLRFCGQPSVGPDGRVYVAMGGFSEGRLAALAPDGTVIWNRLISDFYAPVGQPDQPIVAKDGMVYWSGPSLIAVDSSGTNIWEYSAQGLSNPPCLGADDSIYFATTELATSRIIAFNRDGSAICEYELSAKLVASPVLRNDGVLLVALSNGKLQALQVSASPPEDSSWPMARHDAKGSSSYSLARPTPPPLHATIELGHLILSLPPTSFSVTVLQSGDLARWQILTNAVARTNSLILELPVEPNGHQFYRCTVP
jgi:outer membrane protein assembly factor BamB